MNSPAGRLCEGGVEYLHGVKLVHGDLRFAPNLVKGSPRFTRSPDADPQTNILITSDKPVRACLADFGFMTIVYDDADGPESTSALGGGTMPFMAPELLSPSTFGMVILQVCLFFRGI